MALYVFQSKQRKLVQVANLTNSAQVKSSVGGTSAHARTAGAGPGAFAGGMMTGAEGVGEGVRAGVVPGGQRLQVAAQ